MPDASRHIDHPGISDEYKIEQLGGQLGAALDRRFEQERASMGSHNTFNGSTKYVNAMLTLLTGLMLAGIVGGISLYANVAALTQKVSSTNEKVDLIIAGKLK